MLRSLVLTLLVLTPLVVGCADMHDECVNNGAYHPRVNASSGIFATLSSMKNFAAWLYSWWEAPLGPTITAPPDPPSGSSTGSSNASAGANASEEVTSLNVTVLAHTVRNGSEHDSGGMRPVDNVTYPWYFGCWGNLLGQGVCQLREPIPCATFVNFVPFHWCPNATVNRAAADRAANVEHVVSIFACAGPGSASWPLRLVSAPSHLGSLPIAGSLCLVIGDGECALHLYFTWLLSLFWLAALCSLFVGSWMSCELARHWWLCPRLSSTDDSEFVRYRGLLNDYEERRKEGVLYIIWGSWRGWAWSAVVFLVGKCVLLSLPLGIFLAAAYYTTILVGKLLSFRALLFGGGPRLGDRLDSLDSTTSAYQSVLADIGGAQKNIRVEMESLRADVAALRAEVKSSFADAAKARAADRTALVKEVAADLRAALKSSAETRAKEHVELGDKVQKVGAAVSFLCQSQKQSNGRSGTPRREGGTPPQANDGADARARAPGAAAPKKFRKEPPAPAAAEGVSPPAATRDTADRSSS